VIQPDYFSLIVEPTLVAVASLPSMFFGAALAEPRLWIIPALPAAGIVVRLLRPSRTRRRRARW